ncbi:MAG TPA: cation transporter [Bryobacteraceae bacterium]|nr:cation transporter [Bryobacteraceae bacterium]
MNTIEQPSRPSSALLAAGRRWEYLGIAWTLIEAGAGIAAGVAAASIALLGFGADSVIEVASGAILLWRLSNTEEGQAREKMALKLVGICFFLLAAYVLWESGRALLTREAPAVSYFGIGFSALCLVVMPLLARAKRRIAVQIGSRALSADSRQNSICAYLAAILLGGLVLNAVFGWWWADPVAALAMLPIILREGLEALRGEGCDCGR